MEMETGEVLRQLYSGDAEERLFALVYIARMNLQPALLKVMEALHDSDMEVRATAAWALDLMGNPASVPALVTALEDAEYHVRSTAGWALTHLGHWSVPYVVEVLNHSHSLPAREMAYQILRRSEGELAHQALSAYAS